jgi:tetratricopeptide (TPR) repeat protein
MAAPVAVADRGSPSRFIVLLLAVAITAAYANGLLIPFHFDDWHVIEENPYIRSLDNVPRFFVDPGTFSVNPRSRLVRPVLLTTFAVNYAVSGAATWSYHLVNLLLHWVAAVLVFRIVRDHLWLGEGRLPVATAAAFLVALHPLNTEPVNYISARSALLATALYLGAFDAAVRGRRRTCQTLFVLALLTKTIAITLPVVLLAYWLLARRRARTRNGAATAATVPWRFLGTLAGLGLVVGLLYPWALMAPGIRANMSDIDAWAYFLTGWSTYLYYARLFLWPNALAVDRPDYPLARSVSDPSAWGSVAAVLLVLVAAWGTRRRCPALAFAVVWYLVTLAPESLLFPLAEPVNEHRPYLAMLGLSTAAGLALWQLARMAAARHAAPPAWVLAVALAFLASLLGTVTVSRNRVWQSEQSLWRDTVEKAPGNARAWMNVGHDEVARGDYAGARASFLRALALIPCYADVHMNLSVLESRAGDDAASLSWADEAVRCEPDRATSHYYRALALERVGRGADALAEYRETTRLDPQHAKAWFAIGRVLETEEDWARAVAAYDRALLESDGTHTEAAMNAGLIYHYRLSLPAHAAERYRAVLDRVPSHYGAQYQIAVSLLASGHTEEAAAAWRRFARAAEKHADYAALETAPAALRASLR